MPRIERLVEAEEAAGKIVLRPRCAEGRFIGIEVLGARKGLPKELLDEAERL
jgi:hypothetical protein